MRTRYEVIVITGISGAGKTELAKIILANDDDITKTVSATTRRSRPNERHGVDYYFLKAWRFWLLRMLRGFLEVNKYGQTWYGTLLNEVERVLISGKTVLLVLDYHGVEAVKNHYPSALVIWVDVTIEEAMRRIQQDRPMNEDVLAARMAIAKDEIAWAENSYGLIRVGNMDRTIQETYKAACHFIYPLAS